MFSHMIPDLLGEGGGDAREQRRGREPGRRCRSSGAMTQGGGGAGEARDGGERVLMTGPELKDFWRQSRSGGHFSAFRHPPSQSYESPDELPEILIELRGGLSSGTS